MLLLLFSWFGQECECPEAGCAKGGGAASRNKPRLSPVFRMDSSACSAMCSTLGRRERLCAPSGSARVPVPWPTDGPGLPGRESAPKLLFFPDLCASRVLPIERLPPPCRRVYSSPSRRTPVDAAARTPRTGYCGRRRRSDRPFRTGFIRWLEEGCEVFHKPPSFMNSLNPFIFKLTKSFFGRRVRSWLRTNAGGAPNTCKSRG